MDRISQHISYWEAVKSPTAIRLGIRNVPNYWQLENMKTTAREVFEPLRFALGGKPIKINSFFRSTKLNRAVGGSRSSQHVKGMAMDLDDTYGGATNKEMFEFIRDNMVFDQLIWEYGNDENPAWVHVSYDESRNRMQVFRIKK